LQRGARRRARQGGAELRDAARALGWFGRDYGRCERHLERHLDALICGREKAAALVRCDSGPEARCGRSCAPRAVRAASDHRGEARRQPPFCRRAWRPDLSEHVLCPTAAHGIDTAESMGRVT
jgi:hypothetical protein